jgi:tetratricopeptide (TPR) repeat protein
MRASGEELFARNIRVMQLELQAWLAHVAKQGDSSRVLMQAAVQLEESTPKHAVTPGPTIPAAELLGDLLMEDDHPREALAAYTRALELYPNRFNALLGAARAARGAGENAAARAHYSVLIGIAAGGQRTSEIKEARDYLAAAR